MSTFEPQKVVADLIDVPFARDSSVVCARVAPAMYALSLVSLGLRLQLLFCYLDSNCAGCKTQLPSVEPGWRLSA